MYIKYQSFCPFVGIALIGSPSYFFVWIGSRNVLTCSFDQFPLCLLHSCYWLLVNQLWSCIQKCMRPPPPPSDAAIKSLLCAFLASQPSFHVDHNFFFQKLTVRVSILRKNMNPDKEHFSVLHIFLFRQLLFYKFN